MVWPGIAIQMLDAVIAILSEKMQVVRCHVSTISVHVDGLGITSEWASIPTSSDYIFRMEHSKLDVVIAPSFNTIASRRIRSPV